jgi:hypothetical protein
VTATRGGRRALHGLLLVVGLIAALLVPAVGASGGAGAAPSVDVSAAANAYELARSQLATAEAALAQAQARRDAAEQTWSAAVAARAAADADLADQRDRYGTLSAEYFVRQGTGDADVTGSMRLAMAGGRQGLDRAKAAVEAAAGDVAVTAHALADRQADLDRAGQARDTAQAAATEAGQRADTAIAAAGVTDLPAVAYAAYRRAADRADTAHPDCHLPAAVLAGIGRISSSHGRNLGSSIDDLGRVSPALRGLLGTRTADTDGGALDGDSGGDRAMGPMQLTPAVWAAHATDGDGDGVRSPDDIFDAAATTAEALCTTGEALDTFAALDRAVVLLLGEGQQSTVVLGAARRYAHAGDLDLGSIPVDPRVLVGDGGMQFDAGAADLAQGDVLGMLGWALTRLGTPYSQCLGPDVRPQDPVCPPGTNRYGSGFFDCSGFVSHAYRSIGIVIPATTFAMEADPRFMATEVSDRIDLSVMQPGDVFLMDGHTGMYVGGGMIVHAIGRGLTYEPVPGWVTNGTFAVLRPLLLV